MRSFGNMAALTSGPGKELSKSKRDTYLDNPPTDVHIPPAEQATFVSRLGSRFLKSFALATFFWALFSLVTITSANASDSVQTGEGYDEEYTISAGNNIVRCTQGNGWQTPSGFTNQGVFGASNLDATGQTSFNLPISAVTLFFVSRGRNLGGAITVVTSPNQAANSASVQVVVSSTNEDALGATSACLLTRTQGGIGVGVFTPWSTETFPDGWNSNFHITVILPDDGDKKPLKIQNFETDLPNSSHQVGDLSRKVLFSRLSLGGSNAPITVNSVNAKLGIISTSDAPITGSFNTTNTLTLSTSNGPINVNVGLTSTGPNARPALRAYTSNGPLVAHISLISSSGSEGSFSVNARTSNQQLQLSFPTSPAGSQLILDASTSNSPASVFLHPLYTGGFNLQTSAFENAQANNVHPELTERQVHISNIGKGTTSGEVFWQTGPNANGMVSVSTANGDVLLDV